MCISIHTLFPLLLLFWGVLCTPHQIGLNSLPNAQLPLPSPLNVPKTVPPPPPPLPPLYITPLLDSGRYAEAQAKSRVGSDLVPGVAEAGYSAFFTIDAARGTHLHFWMVPKENCEHWRREPLILWLQGGIGLTTLRGGLQENLLPFNVSEEGTVGKFDFGLTRYMNVLMMDNTRTGFSHTQDPSYVVSNYEMVAEELYAALTQFFLLFPDMKRSVYIGATSAGASKVTNLGELILKRDPNTIHLAGVVIGDGGINLSTDFSLQPEYLYNLGLINKRVVRNASNLLDDLYAARKSDNPGLTHHIYRNQLFDLYNRHIGYRDTDIQDIMHAFRFRDHWLDFIDHHTVRNHLHVGRLRLVVTDPNSLLLSSAEKATNRQLEFILQRRVPVLKYQGQYDGLLSYQSTINTLRSLNWQRASCLRSPQFRRSQLWIRGQLFGYLRQCGNLWEVLALRAAHVVQLSAAHALWSLVRRFVDEGRNRVTGEKGI